MDSAQIFGENRNIVISVLPGETINSLLNGWVENLPVDDKPEIQEKINSFAESIKTISPRDIENKNISTEIMHQVSEILIPFQQNQSISNSFFNVLNLCVVGLGTRLKTSINE
jgi:hypothetical protein